MTEALYMTFVFELNWIWTWYSIGNQCFLDSEKKKRLAIPIYMQLTWGRRIISNHWFDIWFFCEIHNFINFCCIFWCLIIYLSTSYQLDIKTYLTIFLISAWSKNVRISVSDHLLTTLDSSSDSLMVYILADRAATLWKFHNFEKLMPANVKGRYVYTYLIADGDIYFRELEVFAPFTYGQ